jgi:hypothetical protein
MIFEQTSQSKTSSIPHAIEIKDPTPAPPDNGEPEEKRRGDMDISAPGMTTGYLLGRGGIQG